MKKDDTNQEEVNTEEEAVVPQAGGPDDALVKAQQEALAWKEKCLRAIADYQNLVKRTREELREMQDFALVVFLERLLPIVDTVYQAQAHLSDQGLGLALKELTKFLTEQGVEKIDTTGKMFNPLEMECIEVIDGDDEKVMSEVAPGYRLRGKVFRVAKVQVGKKI